MCNIFYCHILDVSQQEMSKFVEMHEHVMDVIDGINKSFADTISVVFPLRKKYTSWAFIINCR